MRRVLQAWKTADKVLQTHNVHRAPVDVRAIASKYATVVERPLDNEISGVVAPLEQNRWIIMVNSTHPPVRQRFTIAHELGHVLLHGYTSPHADRTFRFRDARSSEGSALEEIQANQFAAAVLMPRVLLLKAVRAHSLDHAPSGDADDEAFESCVAELAKRFQVSRQAMTIRLSSLFA
jgi:Zn-dependent peptidase ImmA (M78 family)